MGNELQRADKGFPGVLRSLIMSGADRINAINRNLIEYQPCAVDAFFEPGQGVFNAIVSGGDNRMRVNAMVAQIACAISNGFPVVVLHEGNRELEEQMRSNFLGTGQYIEIGTSSPVFEPFYGLGDLEIANQILETASRDFDIKYNVRYYIEGVSKILNKRKKHLSFKMLFSCPHALIFDKVDELRMQGIISDSEEHEIKSKLMMGQSENYKLDTFLNSLKMEISPLMYVAKQGYKPVSIVSSLKRNAVLCMDIGSIANKLLLNTIFYQLKLSLTKGLRYAFLVDSIPLGANEAYAAYMRFSTDKVCRMISSDDFYAMVGSDEKIFSSAVGDSQILIVMGHTSGNSATKWAEVFGKYDKLEQSYSISKGSSKRTAFSLFSSPNQQKTSSISKNREYIIKPEMITRMGCREAYVLTAVRGELAHLVLNG